MKTILTPIDFSTATNRVCAEATVLAQAIKGRVLLLHCVAPPIVATDLGPGIENIVELTLMAKKTATKELAQLKKKLAPQKIAVDSVLVDGAPGPQIVAQARTRGADYIVVGTHGHTALYDLLVGSTTQYVLKKAPCPVVVVPPLQKVKRSKPRKNVRSGR